MREIVSKVQTMRKESGFEVTDHIRLYYDGDAEIDEVFNRYMTQISGDVLADEIVGKNLDGEKSWDINGKSVRLKVGKL